MDPVEEPLQVYRWSTRSVNISIDISYAYLTGNIDMARYFDPKVYRIVLVDQRGCGDSTPFANLEENTTYDSVRDFEKIRVKLGIERWQVFGGSWGSTLSLVYAVGKMDIRLYIHALVSFCIFYTAFCAYKIVYLHAIVCAYLW